MWKINIIGKNNGLGLSRNICILKQVFGNLGAEVTITNIMPREYEKERFPKLYRRMDIFQGAIISKLMHLLISKTVTARFDLNIFLESIRPDQFLLARKNWLIPNQEWFEPAWQNYFSAIDLVLCKTHYAQKIFSGLNTKSIFISFTSIDRLDGAVSKDFRHFFHLAGQSPYKGTTALVGIWARHPDWPRLTIVQHPMYANLVRAEHPADNIEHIVTNYLDDSALVQLQNACGVHICPSESEGFGHYILEGMSCESAIVTTDAPPMNEMVSNDRGVLVGYSSSKQVNLGDNYMVNPTCLESAIESLLNTDQATLRRMGQQGRAWFIENDAYFRHALGRCLEEN